MKYILSILLGCFVLLANPAEAKSVLSLSAATKTVSNDGQSYNIVRVSCAKRSVPQKIQKLVGDRKWCVSQDPENCSNRKMQAAIQACKTRYQSQPEPALTHTEPTTPAPDTNKATASPEGNSLKPGQSSSNADQLAIEAELIEIEQRRIEIRRRQIELAKKELELQSQK